MHIHFIIYPSVIFLLLPVDTPAITMGSMLQCHEFLGKLGSPFGALLFLILLLLLVSYVFVWDFSCSSSCTFLWVLASGSGLYDEHLLSDHTGPFPSFLSFLWDRVSLYSPDWTGTFSRRRGWLESDGEWLTFASLECWDSRWAPPHLAVLSIWAFQSP